MAVLCLAKDLADLKKRLGNDRRCYAYFHPSLPDDPLIFVEIALTRGIPGSIQGVLTEERDVLRLVDGRATVQEIAERLTFGEFDSYRILAELLTRNLVVEIEAPVEQVVRPQSLLVLLDRGL